MTVPAELLAWDSDFFGIRVARAVDTASFGEGSGGKLVAWCEAQGVAWVYALLPPTSVASREAERHGLSLTDIRVEMSGQPSHIPDVPHGTVRPFLPADLPAMRELARISHGDSRFFADQKLPREQAERLFERWIERDSEPSPSRWAGVAVLNEAPAGYLTAHVDRHGTGWIGLVAVASTARGRGLGTSLLAAAGRWMAERGVLASRVVTQGRNIAAQRMYQQAGFRTDSIQLWYHRWFPT